MKRALIALAVAVFIGVGALSLADAQEIPDELKNIGVTEHLGDSVSIRELQFRDESGATVSLAKYFNSQKPVLLTLVYYDCPNLCNFMLNGLVHGLKKLDWTPGNQFEIVTVSIDSREGAELAAKKKAAYLASYGRPEAAAGWHFLTGSEAAIKKLAAQVGFGFRYDTESRQFAHSAAIDVLTPEGKISRYLYGIEFQPTDVKLSLLEAANGKIGTIVDRLLMFCYRYDPKAKKYSVFVTKLMRTGGAGTVLVFGSYLAVFWRRQRKFNPAESRQGG